MNIAPRSLSRTRRKWLWRIALLALPPLLIAGAFARLRTWRPRTLHTETLMRVHWLQFLPDGERLAVLADFKDNSKSLWLWDTATGRQVWSHDAGGDVDTPCLMLHNGRIVTNGESLRIWNDKGDVLDDRRDGGSEALAASGDLLAQGGDGAAVSLWNLKNSPFAPGEPRRFGDDSSFVHALALSPDGAMLASSDYIDITPSDKKDNAVHVINLWDVKSGKLKRRLQPLNDNIRALAFSPDDTQLAARVDSMTTGTMGASVWNVATGKTAFRFGLKSGEDGLENIAFSPNGTLLAVNSGAAVELRDARSGVVKRTLKVPESEDTITAFAFAPDGATLAMGSDKGAITLWRLK